MRLTLGAQLEALDSDDALYALSLQREERGTEAPSQADMLKNETLSRLAGLKETIDRKTQRYKAKTGLGLDLVYVEDNVLSMGFPSSGQIKKLAAFLQTTHKEYRVYNLCEEEQYDQKKFADGTFPTHTRHTHTYVAWLTQRSQWRRSNLQSTRPRLTL